MPRRSQRSGFHLPIAYNKGRDEIGIVEELNLASRQIVGSPPIRIHAMEQLGVSVVVFIVGKSDFCCPQAQGVGYHRYGAQAHRGPRDNRAE